MFDISILLCYIVFVRYLYVIYFLEGIRMAEVADVTGVKSIYWDGFMKGMGQKIVDILSHVVESHTDKIIETRDEIDRLDVDGAKKRLQHIAIRESVRRLNESGIDHYLVRDLEKLGFRFWTRYMTLLAKKGRAEDRLVLLVGGHTWTRDMDEKIESERIERIIARAQKERERELERERVSDGV